MLARREFFGQADEKLESWAKAIPLFEPYFSASQICSSWEKIAEYLVLEEEKIWHLGEVDRKTKDYRASLGDITKSEWILEKLQETEKLIKQLMQTYQKQAYVLTEEAKQNNELEATENEQVLLKEIEDIRNTVLQQQKESGTVNRSHKSSHLGNSGDQSKSRRSVTGGSNKIASVATSRSSKRQESDKLELENLKAKQEDEQRFREREMQLQNECEEMEL